MKKELNRYTSKLSLLLLFSAIGFGSVANNMSLAAGGSDSDITRQKICFTENKGQVRDQDQRARPDVLFSGTDGQLVYHLKNNGISYQLNKVKSWKKILVPGKGINQKEQTTPDQIDVYRLDVNWVNVNVKAGIKTGAALEGHENYYTRGCANGALMVKSYKSVSYQKIYPGIDLIWYQKDGRLKYDYVVAAGANYKDIQLDIQGAEKIWVNDKGELILETPFGDVAEQAPLVTQNGSVLKSRWLVNDHRVAFEIDNIDPGQTVIIDPAVRVWGTYYGGSGAEMITSTTIDAFNNVYSAGYTDSGGGTTIATSGSHQSTFNGTVIAFLMKLNASGIRQWGTYYGDAQEFGNSCAADASGNVYLAGQTSSTTGTVIATPGSHQAVFGGGNEDAFLVKFDANGVRLWGTYYGGSGSLDNGNTCATDVFGNVYLSGQTTSASGSEISTPGSHQEIFGNNVDAFLVKFNGNGVRQWATYYGGPGLEYGYCTTDPSGNVYLTGLTTTWTGTAIATSNGHQANSGGGIFDAFLAKFDANGVRQWGTYYGGLNSDQASSCTSDASGNIFMAGYTDANTPLDTIATTGSHQTVYGGGVEDAFLVKFNAAGVRQWGTYYGGTGSDFAYSCSADASGNVYLAGSTTSTAGGVIATPGSYQSVIPGNVFLVKFNQAGVRLWGTYYGGSAIDFSGAYACTADGLGNSYLAGFTDAAFGTNIATPGSHQDVFGGLSDGFLVKFNDCTAATPPSAINGLTTTCPGLLQYSVSPVPGAVSYSWLLPAGWIGSSTTNTIGALSGSSGTISVSASNACGKSDPQKLSVTIQICSGVNEFVNEELQVNVFPNPNNGQFELNINGAAITGQVKIKMYDLVGALVLETEFMNDDTTKKINASQLSKGVYFVKVYSDSREYVKKIVVNP